MKKLLFPIALVSILISCRGGGERNLADSKSPAVSGKMATDMSTATTETPPHELNQVIIERKIIKSGNVRFETSSLSNTRITILESLKKHNGYVSREEESNYGDRIEQNIEARIPSEEFDVFLAEITAGVKRFDFKNINTNDVTEEFIDVESRLNTKKELEKEQSAINCL